MKDSSDPPENKDSSNFAMVAIIFGAVFGSLAVPLSLFLFLKYF